MGSVADSKKHVPSHVCYLSESGRFAIKDVVINRGLIPKMGITGAPFPWDRGVADPVKTNPLPICVTTPKLVVLHQRVCT